MSGNTPTPSEMDEAYDKVLAIWGVTYDDVDEDCYNGHFDCSYCSGGPCMTEAGASQAAKIVRLRNAEESKA